MTASVLIYWFDCKWTVQSINKITEPKKSYGEVYRDGEVIQAKIGSAGPYPGTIVKVSVDRDILESLVRKVEQVITEKGALSFDDLLLELTSLEKQGPDAVPSTDLHTASGGTSKSAANECGSLQPIGHQSL
ncbi:hypothetical protein ScPMuIL_001236 [Solemya velum]